MNHSFTGVTGWPVSLPDPKLGFHDFADPDEDFAVQNTGLKLGVDLHILLEDVGRNNVTLVSTNNASISNLLWVLGYHDPREVMINVCLSSLYVCKRILSYKTLHLQMC
uniref:Uncharacterized protein n=1 Tax=Lepeophtheirus salmonis TaxID=72036 RepID=A0A0K2SVV4_LEPSM